MQLRPLGRTGLHASPIGFGAFKIGRNEKTKYPAAYDLPDDRAVQMLLDGVLAAGINYIDTAPAYGTSEERIGRALAHRRDEFILSTKVGENFANGQSSYDFSRAGVEASLKRSFERLKTDVLDLVFIHSDGNDLRILNETDVVPVLCEYRKRGQIRAIGLSGKTPEGARASLEWADAVMVEYNSADRSHEAAIREAGERGIAVIVKKGLASGHLPAADAIRFLLANEHVGSIVIGGLNLDHILANIAAAENLSAT